MNHPKGLAFAFALVSLLTPVSLQAAVSAGRQPEVATDMFEANNYAPRINSLLTGTTVLQSGDQTELSTSVFDPEGDNLFFYWQAPAGQFGACTGTCSSISWTAPNVNQTSTFQIYCEVGDGKGKIDTREISTPPPGP